MNGHKGNVIFQANGILGSVCDASWDITNANAMCQQLGFRMPTAIFRNSYFGPVNMSFGMIHIKCIGNDALMQDCPHNISRMVQCGNNNIAGVQCKLPGKSSLLIHICLSLLVFSKNQIIEYQRTYFTLIRDMCKEENRATGAQQVLFEQVLNIVNVNLKT